MSDAEAAPTQSSDPAAKQEEALAGAIAKLDDEAEGEGVRHNADQPNPIISAILVVLLAFKLTMASLLILMIAQTCPGDISLCGPDARPTPGTNATTTLACFAPTCRQQEVLNQLPGSRLFAFIFNFITLAALLTHQYVVWARERFLLQTFTDSEDIEDDLLGTVLFNAPKEIFKSVGERFKIHNYRVIISAAVSSIITLVNIIVSAIVIFQHNDGTRSATQFLTNVVLIATVFSGVIKNARAGLWKEGVKGKKGPPKVYSLMSSEPFQWNLVKGEETYMMEYAKQHDDDK